MEETLAVGWPEEWAHFRSRYPEFLQQLPKVVALAERALDQAKPASPVDIVIHCLTRMCAEEMMEIVLVCGNGYGIAGMKLVRTLYENAVTVRYLHLAPSDVHLFLDYVFVAEKKILDAIEQETGEPTPPELRETTEREFERVKTQFEVQLCPRCHARGMNYRWSKLDFVSMAGKCKGLDDLLIPAYRDTLRYTHAGVGGLFARLEGDAEGVGYRAAPHRREAASALQLAHDMVLRVVAFAMEHFQVQGLDEELNSCIREFLRIWKVKPGDFMGQPRASST